MKTNVLKKTFYISIITSAFLVFASLTALPTEPQKSSKKEPLKQTMNEKAQNVKSSILLSFSIKSIMLSY